MSESPKFCVDCQWHRENYFGEQYGCAHLPDDELELSLVTGEMVSKTQKILLTYPYCSVMRLEGGHCGVEGKHFEAKQPKRDLSKPKPMLRQGFIVPVVDPIKTNTDDGGE